MQTQKRDNEFEWNQFIRLGEMMGDGLHHEPDGKWISREYNRLARILIPELKDQAKELRKQRAEHTNSQIDKLLSVFRCSCGGQLVQKRSGTKICYCTMCGQRYKAKAVSKKCND